MKHLRRLLWIGLGWGIVVGMANPAMPNSLPLNPVDPGAIPLPMITPEATASEPALCSPEGLTAEGRSLLQAVDYSRQYLNTAQARSAYRQYPVPGVTRDRIRRSLNRFRQLLIACRTDADLQAAVAQEFVLYQAAGQDGLGTVAFTGYFEPTYAASRVPTPEYRYPLYRLPPTLDRWATPHPTRSALEGADGLQGGQGPLRGLELVWLRDRLEAYLVQVQGSARLQLTDGTVMSVGYAGRTDYPYTSIGRELINDGKIAEADLTLPVLLDYFHQHPDELDLYLPRNQRFVFFTPTNGAPPTGSLGVPVTAGRSIATDKSLMPPGALAIIALNLPHQTPQGDWQSTWTHRYVLDQDTGGAIRGAGRVDLFVGTGVEAGEQAGLINTTGQLYYLLLRL